MAKESICAAVSSRDITPPVGTSLSGFGYGRRSTYVNDQLHVRALALENQDGHRGALVSTDLLGLTADQVATVQMRLGDVLEPGQLVLTQTHTHSGPSIGLLRDTEQATPDYLEGLIDAIVATVEETFTQLVPASVSVGVSSTHVGINRRLPEGDAILLEPNPDGSCDREVLVLRVEDIERTPLACWFRLAAHPVTLGSDAISGDWPAEAARLVRQRLGCTEAIFSQGCCGDVSPIVRGFEQARLACGELAAFAVDDAWRRATPINLGEFRSAVQACDLPVVRPPTVDELPARLEVQVLRLGEDLAIVGLSAEPFSNLRPLIQQRSTAVYTAVLGYTNGCFGYLPDADAFVGAEGQRGYEVDDAPWWFRTPPLTPESVDVALKCVSTTLALAGIAKH